MNGDRRPAGSRADRLYRLLLRAFPFDFRTDHGREMEQTFRAQRRYADREGTRAAARLWADTILDLFTTAPREHLVILRQDIAYAFRSLRRAPVFAASVVLTLALGMSATAGMFTIVNAVMLRPLPVDRPEQLVSISHAAGAPFGLSFRDLVDLREERSVLTDLMGYAPRPATLNAGGDPERIVLAAVTDNYFSMLGVQPAAGRLIRPDEGRAPGDAPVVVLAHDYWAARFNSDPSVIGRAVRLRGRPYTIIGIASNRFSDTDALVRIDAYVPAWRLDDFSEATRTTSILNERSFRQFTALARLKPGVSLAQARSALEIRNAAIVRDYSPSTDDLSLRVVPETHARPNPEFGPRLRMAATAMMGLSLLLLLITSASVTNLLMARAGSRRRELAVRAALGARRGRVVRQLLTETVVLALMAAVAAVPIVVAVTHALRDLIASASAVTKLDPDFSVDLRVLAVTLAIAVCAGLVAGVAPAAAAGRTDLTDSLKNGIGATPGTRRQRWRLAGPNGSGLRTTLVVVQVALALALLVSGGLFMRSLDRARSVDLGFDPNDLILASTTPGIAGLDRPQRLAFYQAVRDRVATLPGVEGAAWISFPPLGIIGEAATVSPDERRQDVDWQPPTVSLADVSGEYFATARVPVIEGRSFDDRDTATARPVVIVNDVLARQFWPNRSPIGRRLAVRDATLEVVGVVRTGKYQTVWESPRGAVFRPLAQAAPSLATLTVRASRGAPNLGFGIERIVRDVNPDVAVYDVRSMIEHLDSGSAFFPFRMGAVISSIFGGLGLLLASIALYGMVAYYVGQRTREFGIRMALGARRSDIIGDVLARGGRFALLGVGVGLALAVALAHTLRALLVGVNPFDPVTHASVAGLLVGICLLASFVPAWRATIRDPLLALRSE
jgi:putative ABC transport system permease protein